MSERKKVLVLPLWDVLREKVRTGEKDVDLRLDDGERFKKLQVGDILAFVNIRVEVTGVRKYLSLGDALVNEDFQRFAPGYTLDEVMPYIPRLFPNMAQNPQVIAIEFTLLK